jgi:hypothetical protein
MSVPNLLVVLILVFDGDQVSDFGLSEVEVVPEALGGSPDLVLSLIP